MSLLPDLTDKHCFSPCLDYKVKMGQCACHNRVSSLSVPDYKSHPLEEQRKQIDANEFIDRAIEMLKEEFKYNDFIAGYNGIVSLLRYAKESHKYLSGEKDKRIADLEFQNEELIRQAGNAQDTLIKKIGELEAMLRDKPVMGS